MRTRHISFRQGEDPRWREWAIANGLDPNRVNVPNEFTLSDDGQLTIKYYAKLNEDGRKYIVGGLELAYETITVLLKAPYPDAEEKTVDELIPGNSDPDRRGRVAYERYHVALTSTRIDWVRLSAPEQTAWCHAAEAAFEEGRAFEKEQARQRLDELRKAERESEAADPRYQEGSDW